MTIEPATALVLAIVFSAALLRSFVGFGDAMVAMPLLVLVVSTETATPLVGLVGATLAVTLVSRLRHAISVGAVARLVAATVAGVPVGLLLLTGMPETWARWLLGAVLVGYGSYRLVRRGSRLALTDRRWALPFGFMAGCLGGAYNTSGPPIVIYGSTQTWSPDVLKATLQGYFLFSSALIVAGHGLAGLWTQQVLGLYALSLPLIAAGIAVGLALGRHVNAARFERLLLAVIVLLGVLVFTA